MAVHLLRLDLQSPTQTGAVRSVLIKGCHAMLCIGIRGNDQNKKIAMTILILTSLTNNYHQDSAGSEHASVTQDADGYNRRELSGKGN